MTTGWDDYLRAAMTRRKFATAAELSRASGVGESLISRWLREATQPDVANLRRLSGVLKVPLLELMVAAGHITPTEARLADVKPSEPEPVSVENAVEQDPVLHERAKRHLLDQYDMLRELSLGAGSKEQTRPSTQAGGRPLRAVARKRPPRDQP